MRATRILLLAGTLALLGTLAAAPVATAHVELHVTLCDPDAGVCRCRHVATIPLETVHLHTLCTLLA